MSQGNREGGIVPGCCPQAPAGIKDCLCCGRSRSRSAGSAGHCTSSSRSCPLLSAAGSAMNSDRVNVQRLRARQCAWVQATAPSLQVVPTERPRAQKLAHSLQTDGQSQRGQRRRLLSSFKPQTLGSWRGFFRLREMNHVEHKMHHSDPTKCVIQRPLYIHIVC